MYNKNQFKKVNTKKKLHKVKKQWLVLGAASFALLAGGSILQNKAFADTVNDNVSQLVTTEGKPSSNISSNISTKNSSSSIINSNVNSNSNNSSGQNSSTSAQAKSPTTRSDVTSLNTSSAAANSSANLTQVIASETPMSGTWGSAKWTLDNHHLTIYGGTMSSRVTDQNLINHFKDVDSISFNNAIAPKGSQMLFKPFVNLKTLDLTGLDVNNVLRMANAISMNSNLTKLIFPDNFKAISSMFTLNNMSNFYNIDTLKTGLKNDGSLSGTWETLPKIYDDLASSTDSSAKITSNAASQTSNVSSATSNTSSSNILVSSSVNTIASSGIADSKAISNAQTSFAKISHDAKNINISSASSAFSSATSVAISANSVITSANMLASSAQKTISSDNSSIASLNSDASKENSIAQSAAKALASLSATGSNLSRAGSYAKAESTAAASIQDDISQANAYSTAASQAADSASDALSNAKSAIDTISNAVITINSAISSASSVVSSANSAAKSSANSKNSHASSTNSNSMNSYNSDPADGSIIVTPKTNKNPIQGNSSKFKASKYVHSLKCFRKVGRYYVVYLKLSAQKHKYVDFHRDIHQHLKTFHAGRKLLIKRIVTQGNATRLVLKHGGYLSGLKSYLSNRPL